MAMSKRAKTIWLVAADLCVAAYIVCVFCAFHSPSDEKTLCTGVAIYIADSGTHGFIDEKEVVARLKTADLYPTGQPLTASTCRDIEEALLATPFVRTAQCYTTIDGIVNIEVTQRMPIVRIMASNSDDYYVDDKGCVMPLSSFTANLLIATGDISRSFATAYIAPLVQALRGDDFAANLFQQINITAEQSVELVPLVGRGLIVLGQLPQSSDDAVRAALIGDYVAHKMDILKTFYKYGLSKVGWEKYSTINLEYDNQIVCRRRQG